VALVTLEQVAAALNLGDTEFTSHALELELFIDAAEQHALSRGVILTPTEYTEKARFSGLEILPRRWPVISVASIVDDNGTEYTDDFTVGDDLYSFTHDSVLSGTWTITYTAGYASVPADLTLAALEDIRGLYQPGQVGPLAAFGAFGVENTDTGPTYRPVRQWPRIDAWISYRYGPATA
jgi:hypothetical protein